LGIPYFDVTGLALLVGDAAANLALRLVQGDAWHLRPGRRARSQGGWLDPKRSVDVESENIGKMISRLLSIRF